MDSVFGICGKDWVIVCADTAVNRSIFTLKHDDDKIMQLNQFKVLATTGEQTDRYRYSNLMMRNLTLQEIRTGFEPSVEATANFLRTEMANSLRSREPFQVNVLIGGYDQIEKTSKLYWMDYMGTLQQVTKGAHGYAGYFVNSVLDQHYRQDMTLEQGLDACRQCIKELRTRFIINQPTFVAKVVTADQIQVMPLDAAP